MPATVAIDRRSLVLGLLSCLIVGPATAQSVLRGRVLADSGKRPIAEAEIVVVTPSRTARSDAAGRFVLGDLPAGTLFIRIRAVGFKPLDLEAEIAAHDTVDVDFSLTAAPVQLPTVEVRAKPVVVLSGKMEVFEQRKRLGFGTFLARADLAKWESSPLSIPLRRFSNVRLVPRKWSCGGGFAIASGRGGDAVGECGTDPHACYLAVFIDGVPFWIPGEPGPPNVDDYAAAGLQGVEIYRGAGQLPSELQMTGSACGALVIWTRTGEAEAAPRGIRPAPAKPDSGGKRPPRSP